MSTGGPTDSGTYPAHPMCVWTARVSWSCPDKPDKPEHGMGQSAWDERPQNTAALTPVPCHSGASGENLLLY
jgi:hypothetical protein